MAFKNKKISPSRKLFCRSKLGAGCLFLFKSFKRRENTHQPCSQGLNVSGWNGDCLIVTCRQSILSPADAITRHACCQGQQQVEFTHSAKDSRAGVFTGSNNHQQECKFFFKCKWQTPSTCRPEKQAGGGKHKTAEELTPKPTNKCGSFYTGGWKASSRLEVKGWYSVVFTHHSHYTESQLECFFHD